MTGASRGLGRAIALRFGRERVAVLYHERTEDARQAASEIRIMGGEAASFRVDVGIPVRANEVVETVVNEWGRIDVLINNAGVVSDELLFKMDEADWDEVLRTNLTGPMSLMRAAVPFMQKNGGGHIVNIGSISGLKGREGQTNYAASKGGLWGLTLAAARELGKDNIQVNMVIPGLLSTAMGRTVSPARKERIMQELCLNRTSTPEEVADFVHHLCGMRNVSGQVFNLDSRILGES